MNDEFVKIYIPKTGEPKAIADDSGEVKIYSPTSSSAGNSEHPAHLP